MEHLDDQQDSHYQFDTLEKSDQFSYYSKPQNSNLKLCFFYSNYGFCKFGQNCKFLHRKKLYTSNKPGQRKSALTKSDVSNQLPYKVENNKFSHEQSSNETASKSFQKRTCRYFKAGQCDKGVNCLYNHDIDCNKFKTVRKEQSDKSDHPTKSIKTTSKKKSIPICHYFRRGSCLKGDQCKYYHNPKYQKDYFNTTSFIDENNLSDLRSKSEEEVCNKNTEYNSDNSTHPDIINSENAGNLIPNSELFANHGDSKDSQQSKYLNINASLGGTTNNYTRIQFTPNSRIFSLETLSEDSLYQLRDIEITQLKKRFPKLVENGTTYTFQFEPTDPDWPFETKSFHLQATFPENYPLEVCDISIVSHMNFISRILLRHLNQSICDWLSEKHNAAIELNQVILLFRPFLKWFDKNLEELYSFDLKKMTKDEGVQNTEENPTLSKNSFSIPGENHFENDLPEEDESSLSSNNTSTQADFEKERNNCLPGPRPFINNSQMTGSKVIFTGLELVEGVAVLSCKKLALTIHCGRCKTSCNKIIIPNKSTPIGCSKCSKSMECNFNPSVLHQFSNVLGTIYLLECQAVDINLVECAFLVDCLNCTKQVSVDGLHYGQKQKLWCKFCNQKIVIGIESVKFQASTATAIATSNKTVAVKKVTKIKDPVIKEGCPLPDYGTCKHYKKSYRWLRFPCCGRLYPCDLCHDEKEEDHDMKYASRMVCGFCSKEQPYSKEKPCFGCSSNMTKKSGSYWEGGQGCRNAVAMSRKDVHKYAGMSKTTSKKSQPTGKKKK